MIQNLKFTSQGADARGEDSIACEVRARLRNSSYPEIRRLECARANGVLAVRGRLASFYLKQVAMALIAGVAELDGFEDGIEVLPALVARRTRENVRFDRPPQ
jgi:hypothetical protein